MFASTCKELRYVMGKDGVNRCFFVIPSVCEYTQGDKVSDAYVRCESINSCASIYLPESKEQKSELCERVVK